MNVRGFAAHLCGASAAVAQTAPPLGAAQSIAVLGGSTVTNTTLLVGLVINGSGGGGGLEGLA